MIVVLLGVVGVLLVTAGVWTGIGAPAGLVVAGAGCLAAAWVANRVLEAS